MKLFKINSSERGLISPMELNRPAGRFFYTFFILLLLSMALVWLFPMFWMYTSALKSSSTIVKFPPKLIPHAPIWKNYIRAWTELDYPRYFFNTFMLALGSLGLQMTVSTAAAYSLSKLKPLFSNIILFLFLSTLMVPPMAYLISQYLTVVKVPIFGISLLDSWWGVLLPQTANAFNIFILKSFFDDIPRDLTDAAIIDGAGPIQSFLRIYCSPFQTGLVGGYHLYPDRNLEGVLLGLSGSYWGAPAAAR
jgi:multiple sugar transport system permease protein